MAGLGRVGKALALHFSRHGFQFLGGYSSSKTSTERALAEIKVGQPLSRGKLREAELVFLCTPEGEIQREAEKIAEETSSLEGLHFLHCSGSLKAEVLMSLRAKGAGIGVFHPLFPFIDLDFSLRNLEGAFVGIEGDYFDLAREVGLRPFPLPQNRALYHAGAVLSAGLLVSYLSFPLEIAEELGIPLEAYLKLAEKALGGLKEKGIFASITGPWVRREDGIIEKHLSALREREIYHLLLERAKKFHKKEE